MKLIHVKKSTEKKQNRRTKKQTVIKDTKQPLKNEMKDYIIMLKKITMIKKK
jgi:hypothetical protein